MPGSAFDYIEVYPTFFYVVRFPRMRPSGHQLEVWVRFSERRAPDVTVSVKPWDHWGNSGALPVFVLAR